jgi:hypothetical protein
MGRRMVSGLVWGGVVATAVLAGEGRGVASAGEAGSPLMLARRAVSAPTPSPQPQSSRKPTIRGAADANRAWLGAEHKGLTVQKVGSKADRSVTIELRFRQDFVWIGVDAAGSVTVARGGSSIRVSSPEAYEQLQQLLGGSEAIVAARLLLAERESTSDLQAPEMSLLSTAAFAASLAGDVDAPRRLATRFVEKHRGIYRPVRFRGCYDSYTSEVTASWNDMQDCTNEANQDDSLFQRAYRRIACNAVWLLRSETAWFEYLGCLGPAQFTA